MNYISQDFRIQHLPYYTLFAQVGHHHDVLLVMDEDRTIQVCMRYPSNRPPADVTHILSLPFPKVQVLIPQHNLSFVPAEAYQWEDQATYSAYLENRNDLDVSTVKLPGVDTQAIFQFDALLWKRWNRLFPEATFTPHFQAIFAHLPPQIWHDGQQVFVHQDDQQVGILLVVNGAFLFYNTFRSKTTEDLMYYLLGIMQDHTITKLDTLWLCGIDLEHPMSVPLHTLTEHMRGMEAEDLTPVGDDSEQRTIHFALGKLIRGEVCAS